MRYKIAKDARPQVYLLLVATLISFVLWGLSAYFPLVNYLTYPIRILATFIHEGSHVLATLLTGNSVQSLTVASDGSGVVWSQNSGWFSRLLISSAGYLGTTAFGAAILVWMRYELSPRIALLASAGFVGAMTVLFGIIAPVWNFFANVTLGSVAFTVASGGILTAALTGIAWYANRKWAYFALGFIAIQCLANAATDLITLLTISATSDAASDAANMAAATGLPAIVWVFIWIGISLAMISVGLRIYSVSRRDPADDLLFEDGRG